MRSYITLTIALIAFAALIMLPSAGFAQEVPDLAAEEETDKSDKTGTNPINFQRDIRVYNEYSWLNTEGDGNQNLTTLEFRTPFADGKWQFRTRARFNSIKADLNNDGSDDIDESGIGDIDMRVLTVPYLEGANAFAVAMEVFFDTASDDALGSGTTSLGPQAFYVRFFQGGLGPYKGGGLFAPGLQYKFSIDEDDGRSETDQFLIDLNLLVMAEDKQSWFFTDPQIVIDNENDTEFAIIDIEFGWMMTNWFENLKGHSFYIRPSFGVGRDRPTDASIEVAYKIVGW
jgi:hypothetical protein